MDYEWREVSIPVYSNDISLRVSRFIWAWQRKKYAAMGWTVDGGIWPRLRITRPLTFDDYVYGYGANLKGLDALLYSDGTKTDGGIDRGANPIWRNRHNG